MGKYIGRDNPYGLFETQVLTGMNGVLTTFNLTYKVSSPASILVINAGNVLQPGIEYSLSDGGTKIVFSPAPASGFPLYITYLGRELATSQASSLPDGDRGDITVSGSGATWTIDSGAVSYSKIQNISATDRLLGRSTAGAGIIQEIVCTAAGRALIDDVDSTAQRTTLGLGTLSTQNGTFSGTSSGTNTGDQNVFSTIAITGTAGQSNILADSVADTLTLNAGSGISLTTNSTTDTITITSTALADGDRGDITVSGSGATWTIDSGAVSFAKMQNVSGPSLLGRQTGTGSIEQLNLGSGFVLSAGTLNYINSFSDGTAASPGVYFTNETTTGLFRATPNTLSFSTSSTERLRITSVGQLQASDGTVTAPGFSFLNETNLGIFRNSAGSPAMSFATSGVGRVHVTNNGMVIGNQPFTSGTPVGGTINATDAGGTNLNGVNLTIRGGASTGTGTGGAVILQTSPAGVSGTGQNAAVERMRITSAGDVGIGTSSPLSKLHVRGAGTSTGVKLTLSNGGEITTQNDPLGVIDFYSDDASISASGTKGYIGVYNDFNGNWDGDVNKHNTYMAFATSLNSVATERMRITSTGQIRLTDGSTGAPVLSFSSDPDTGIFRPSADQIGISLGGTTRLYMTGQSAYFGNGVSSATPSVPTIRATAGSGTNIAGADLQLAGGEGTGSGAGGVIRFFTAAAGTSGTTLNTLTERMRIDSAGNVGIGVGSPDAPLDLRFTQGTYSTTGNDALRLTNSSTTGQSVIQAQINGTLRGRWRVDYFGNVNYVANGGSHLFYVGGDSSVGSDCLVLESNGSKRFKNGFHYYEASAITSGAGTNALKYHTSTGLVTWDASSRLIKDNIENCPLGLSAVLALKPRKYFRTDDQKNEIGFIADEMEQVIPELVSYAPKSCFTKNEQDTEIVPSSIAYEKLTAILCKAIQELNAKVELLTARIEELE